MRVWLCDIGEPLPILKGRRLLRYGELSRYLVGAGHHVTWWACDFSHWEKKHIAAPGSRCVCNGVDIRLVHGPGYRRNVSLARLYHIGVHARNLRRAIEGESPPDIIVTAMPTTESGEVLLDYARRYGIPLVADIRDEWPEDYVRWLPKPLKALGRAVLRPKFRQLKRVCAGATAIFAVTEKQLAYGLAHGGRQRSARDAVVYLGAPTPRLGPDRLKTVVDAWRSRGLEEGSFICLFAGTMSPSRPLGPVIDAVLRLSSQIRIKLVIAGSGDAEREYRRRAMGHSSVQFVGWTDQEGLIGLSQIADVLIAPYHPDFSFSMPTKLFDYMSAGKPIVSSCPGEARELIERHKFGINYDHDDYVQIERILFELYADPDRRQAMGGAARQLFESQFSIESIVQEFTRNLEALASLNPAR